MRFLKRLSHKRDGSTGRSPAPDRSRNSKEEKPLPGLTAAAQPIDTSSPEESLKTSHSTVDALCTPGTYRYSPLQGKEEFRLIQIWNNPEPSSSARLCCSVESFTLGTSPPFISLSYTWGSPFPDGERDEEYGPNNLRNIAIETDSGERLLAIRKNLHDGLSHLIESGHQGYLWADAICIDEGSRKERAKQVSLMHRIFGKCERVIIWLGKADDTTDDVAWLLRQVEQSPWMQKTDQDEAELFYDWTAKGLVGSKDWLDTVLIPEIPLSDPRWISYYRFLTRSWFQRTWTVQEVALSPETHVLCGDKEFSWKALTILAFMLSDTEYARVLTIYGQQATHHLRTGHSFVGHEIVQLSLCRALCQADQHPGLLDRVWGTQDPIARCLSLYQEALLVTWARAASEPRDKVYGALGIAMRSLPEYITVPIKPDYSIPVDELYKRTSWLLINKLRPLLLLSYAGRHHQRLQGLPSWALDFAGPDGSDNLMSANSKRGSLYWNASRSLPQNDQRSLNGDVLSLHGAILDTVEVIHDINIFDVLRVFLSILPKYHTGESPAEVIWRTLTATSSDPGSEQYRDIFKAWVTESIYELEKKKHGRSKSRYNDCFNYLNQIHAMQKTAEVPYSADIQDHPPGIEDAEKATIFRALIRGYHIYRTSKGYIGSAPQGIKKHDQVWILCGAITPLIFRPIHGTKDFMLVRESYVHGFMHGEAKLADDVRTISIR